MIRFPAAVLLPALLVLLPSALQGSAALVAFADPCPDVETIFARGTDDTPGLGPTGTAFVDALRPKLAGKSLGVYPVDYPANMDWAKGMVGIRDAVNHIESTAASCPKTKMVLSGFSQGAAVMGFTTVSVVPDGVDMPDIPKPMPPEVADHVAAVVLLGTPTPQIMNFVGQPPVTVGPLYVDKTIQLCAPEDPICSDGGNFGAHMSYPHNGVADQGAAYAADRVNQSAQPAQPTQTTQTTQPAQTR